MEPLLINALGELRQHDALRPMVETCRALLDRFEIGAPVAGDLTQAIARLRLAVAAQARARWSRDRVAVESDE